MTRMVVDLPAPFGPTKPVTRPGVTVKVMPSRARVGPNRLRRPVTSMVCVAHVVVRSRVVGTGRSWLYDTTGVNPVSAADTGLTPATCHALCHGTSTPQPADTVTADTMTAGPP